jgi:hypothetical protein
MSDSTTRTFQRSERGLFYMDVNNREEGEQGVTLINTVAANKSSYTNRDYSRAVLARRIQKVIGRPSTRTFLKIVDNNLLPNCPVSRRDIMAAEKIFGPDVGSLKGKTIRKGSERVEMSYADIPASLLSQYREVVLAGDIMFVNKIPFFVTISRYIKFGTTEVLQNQQSKTILHAIRQVLAVYKKRGFIVTTLLMDGQFETLRGELATMQVTLNTVSNDEHVPEVERHIRTIKERARCVYNTLPFNRMPARIVTEMIYYSTFWLNSFPAADGISDTLSPRAIVVGTRLDYAKHCQLEFGSYVQTHEEHDNSMATRTTGAIALRPTGNDQGGYYFFSLNTGRVLNRNRWTMLPMPADVIDRVHAIARRSHNAQGLHFLDRTGNAVLDLDDDGDDDDEDYVPPPDDNDNDSTSSDDDDDDSAGSDGYGGPDETFDDDDGAPDDFIHDGAPVLPDAPIAGVNEHDDDAPIAGAYTDDDAPIEGVHNDDDDGHIGNDGVHNDDDDGHIGNDDGIDDNINDDDGHIGNDDGIDDNADDDDINDLALEEEVEATPPHVAQAMDTKYGARQSEHNLRPRRPRDYSHLHTTLESIAMTQHSMKKGIKIFGDAGVDAVVKELQQLHDRKVLEPKSSKQLSAADKKAALQYLMFLKQKRNGTIKGRGCADGRKQREYTNKEDASSPTVAIESVMLSCVIDAMEGRDVATVDIPGAFMQADMDDIVHMKLEGKMAELLVMIDPKLYRQHVQIERGKQVLYVELRKALYGTLRAALLFWRRLSSELKELGFEINPYDWCVANKMIDGHQCTILWHVDDLKISHVDPAIVTEVIEKLEAIFGSEAPLTKTRGPIHDYLGMTLDFSKKGKVKFTMIDYIKGILEDLPEDMDGEAATPAASHLFDVHEASSDMLLERDAAVMFHHNVAKLLFLCKRARPDIQTAVSFLCTRVKAPDNDDYKKLTRVMRYLRGTVNMPLTLEANNTRVIKWHIDASFAVHPDMKGHTGGSMTLGKGAVYGTSTRQKLNSRSSTEAELIGTHDVMPQVLWTRYFLAAQGYDVAENIVYQDNQSAMLLEKNGKGSSSKRTRHIDIRYFFITDRVASKEISIEYCPTGEMVADFFTKPLQGSVFKKFRDEIMNIQGDPAADSHQDHRSVLETSDGVVRTTDAWTMVHAKRLRKLMLRKSTKSPLKGNG